MMKKMMVSVAVLACVVSAASAAPLVAIPGIGTNVGSYANMISPDGTLVAIGAAKGGDGSGFYNPALYHVGSGTVQDLMAPSTGQATGVGKRSAYNNEVVVIANISGGLRDWNSTTTTWTSRTIVNTGAYPAASLNSLAISSNGDKWYAAGTNVVSNPAKVIRARFQGAAGSMTYDYADFTSTKVAAMGVTPSGYVAGRYTPSGRQAMATNIASTITVPGIYSTTSVTDGGGISDNGTYIVGMGLPNSSTAINVAFIWSSPDANATALPTLPNTTSTAIAYDVSDDGNTVVGYNYALNDLGVGTYYAAIWQKSGSTWTVNKIEDLVGATEMAAAGFSVLNRAFSLTPDGTKIVGVGTGTDGFTKGFVFTIPEPATLAFLALGGLAMLRRRR